MAPCPSGPWEERWGPASRPPSSAPTPFLKHTSSSIPSLFVHPFPSLPCPVSCLPLYPVITPSLLHPPALVFASLLFLGSARVRAVECCWQPPPFGIPMLDHCGWDGARGGHSHGSKLGSFHKSLRSSACESDSVETHSPRSVFYPTKQSTNNYLNGTSRAHCLELKGPLVPIRTIDVIM